jgi:hypothetical protein
MSHDLSRQLYAHIGCGTVPCSCTWDHPPLAVIAVHCWSCTCTFRTVTEMSNHHLDEHEKPSRVASPTSLALAPNGQEAAL